MERPQGIPPLCYGSRYASSSIIVFIKVPYQVSRCQDVARDFPRNQGTSGGSEEGLQSWHGSMENRSSSGRNRASVGNGARSLVCASRKDVADSRCGFSSSYIALLNVNEVLVCPGPPIHEPVRSGLPDASI